MRLRVLVFNVRGFREGVGRVVEAVVREEADIVLLNETGRRRSLRRFADTLGMEVATDPRSPLRRRVKNAVLVRPPWRLVARRLHRFPRSQRFYPRGALIARVSRSGVRLWVASIHLGLHPGERYRHAEELADLVRGLAGPVLVGGDLNETPEGRAVRHLAERFWDVWATGRTGGSGATEGATFPASDPTARIDYLFVSEDLGIEGVAVPGGAAVASASDHRPVVAQLGLRTVPGPGAMVGLSG